MQSLKFFDHFFCKIFQCFVCLNCFSLSFCSHLENRSLYRVTDCLFQVSNAEQLNVFVFLDFFILILNFQNSFCYGVPDIVSIFFTF